MSFISIWHLHGYKQKSNDLINIDIRSSTTLLAWYPPPGKTYYNMLYQVNCLMHLPSIKWTHEIIRYVIVKWYSIFNKVSIITSMIIYYNQLDHYKFILIGQFITGLKRFHQRHRRIHISASSVDHHQK